MLNVTVAAMGITSYDHTLALQYHLEVVQGRLCHARCCINTTLEGLFQNEVEEM